MNISFFSFVKRTSSSLTSCIGLLSTLEASTYFMTSSLYFGRSLHPSFVFLYVATSLLAEK